MDALLDIVFFILDGFGLIKSDTSFPPQGDKESLFGLL